MISMPETLPDDPVLLKQLLAQMVSAREFDQGKIIQLQEQNALLIQRLYGRKSEQSVDPDSPQLAVFNEAESLAEPATADSTDDAEEVVAPIKRRGKRKPLPAELPR
ncbi:MAG: transposase, partial [Pseudomonas sp.]|uniref:transposase domain-containing protein n=1 Tax=Pseudomonas sp. TaxID=306 RepID=UPI003BB52495